MTPHEREVMQMALNCLLAFEKEDYFRWSKEDNACVAALRAALSQPEPEPDPVAWMYVNEDGECEQIEYGEVFDDPSVTPLYTAPPQRNTLTDEQIEDLFFDMGQYAKIDLKEFARTIEAAHGIKENK